MANQNTYEFAGRGTIGYQFADGMAIKASYFGYGSDITPFAGASGRVSVSDIDLVVSQDFKPSEGFKLTPFVGLDWATFNEGYSTSSTATGTKFSGLGIVAGVDVTRALGNSFSLYGNAKESIVFGTTDENETRFNQTSTDRVLFITQVGLGVQYDYCFSNVAANFRLGVEGQWYGGASNTDSENTGLAGFVLLLRLCYRLQVGKKLRVLELRFDCLPCDLAPPVLGVLRHFPVKLVRYA